MSELSKVSESEFGADNRLGSKLPSVTPHLKKTLKSTSEFVFMQARITRLLVSVYVHVGIEMKRAIGELAVDGEQ